jgi:fumarylpyruvate hydrolase
MVSIVVASPSCNQDPALHNRERRMSGHVIDPPAVTAAPIHGSDQTFPVRRVYCIGRNYAAHAIEMGHDPDREPPFFFQKNPDNLDFSGEFPYPEKTSDVHHEIELVVALGRGGRNIPIENALDHVWGYGVGLDMTRRDLQGEAKKMGRPWEVGKAFERSAPMGPLKPATVTGHPTQGKVLLKVNGEVRQQGDLNQLIWRIPEMISYLSEYFALAPGDVIMTGTPAGVGPVVKGDVMEAHVEGFDDVTITVV